MATDDPTRRASCGKPSSDLLAALGKLREMRLNVGVDAALSCVVIDVELMGDTVSCLLSPEHAVALGNKLVVMGEHLQHDFGGRP